MVIYCSTNTNCARADNHEQPRTGIQGLAAPSAARALIRPAWSRELMEYVIRFLAGGLIVSQFAIVGDILRPKSFAGLFGAAPSVALVSLSLAFANHGGAYVSTEGRSMILGA